ncbi:transposase [Allomuricauda taeanensis]|uniref:transposase n=1 Tax=Flagellimonas taeanensis TaxID=1005926 RepID=UPI002E7AB0FD|nr:transposase [Allomuricauda taeanensis]MEE1964573.1 transposase [Allomuricauda taeanensis]
MMSSIKVLEIFCSIDDFCIEFVPFWQNSLIAKGKWRIRPSKMGLSEVMPVQVLFHCSGYRTFKDDRVGIIDFMLTKGNVEDRKPLRFRAFVKKLFGKLFGDKGYISKGPFTELKKNMKTKLLTPMADACHLRKRAVIETIFDQLKNICQVEHPRYRSIANYFNNIFAELMA